MMMMTIQLFLLSSSVVFLEAQHSVHQHHHADTQPESDLRPNLRPFRHTEPAYPDYNYYDYNHYPSHGPVETTTETILTETETMVFETTPQEWDDVEATAFWWWNHQDFSTTTAETNVICNEYEWRCMDGHFCLPESSRCDGIIECLDISDEEQCDSKNSYMGRASASICPLSSSIWIAAMILPSILVKRIFI